MYPHAWRDVFSRYCEVVSEKYLLFNNNDYEESKDSD